MNLSPAWRQVLPGFLLALVALLALYFATGASIVEIWNRSETFAHGYVVAPISLWLIWRRRAELARITPRAEPIWLLAFVAVGLLWLMGDFVAANSVIQFAFAFMIILLVPLLLGTEVAQRILFPLGFLLFAIPFGDFLTPWLMEHTANFTVLALRATGIPVFREGLSFVIPSGAWSVVQACSGIRYLMASVMVGTLFAYLNYASYKKRWIFLVASVITPIIANWLRAYMIVMLGHLSGNRLAVGVDHIIYGWVFFGLIMFAMFAIGSRWTDPDVSFTAPPPRAVAGQSWQRGAVVTAAVLAVLALPVWMSGSALPHDARQAPVLSLPALAGWRPADGPLTDWKPDFENPAASLQTVLTREGSAPVGVYVGYYRHQDQHSKLVTSTNAMINPEISKIWGEVHSGTATVESAGQSLTWRTAELRGEALGALSSSGSAPRLQAWQIYWINGKPFVSDWQAKVYGAWQRLLGHGDDAAVVILYTPKSESADALLRGFVQAQWPALDTWMRGVRDHGPSR